MGARLARPRHSLFRGVCAAAIRAMMRSRLYPHLMFSYQTNEWFGGCARGCKNSYPWFCSLWRCRCWRRLPLAGPRVWRLPIRFRTLSSVTAAVHQAPARTTRQVYPARMPGAVRSVAWHRQAHRLIRRRQSSQRLSVPPNASFGMTRRITSPSPTAAPTRRRAHHLVIPDDPRNRRGPSAGD
jgi:hypothetical protein